MALGLILGCAASGSANAALTLTQAGIDAGFTLSTFFSGGSSYNDIANASLPDGRLVAVDLNNGINSQLMKFADVDGQTLGTPLMTQSLPNVNAIASVGGHVYAGIANGGFYEVSSTLGLTPLSFPGLPAHTTGLWGNQATGHLLGAFGTQIYDLDPVTGASYLVANTGMIDGLSVSPDGTTVYAEINANEVVGYRIGDGSVVFSTGEIGHGPDGTGVISGGQLAGRVVINNNDGTVGLYDPTTGTYTTIASGGTRGDFTSPDLGDGTLFLAFDDATYRLGIANATIGTSTDTPVPEPASLALLGAGLMGLAVLRRRG